MNTSNFLKHKRICKNNTNTKDTLIETLQRELHDNKKQLAAKDRQIQEQAEEMSKMMFLLQERFIDVSKELKEVLKRKDRYADKVTKRVHRTEPKRRKIAIRQNWKCADQECCKELEEYDIDHIIPLSLGGTEDDNNLQALCPGCHRRKTDRERITSLVQTKEPILVCENLESENSS
jgi:predicted O-linked N-acetylglucosamine transferase (SPINDLY family)